ncbi:MAG: cytochrome c biogenesis protein CcdA [Chitinophagales bacterium]|nr:cytochrome c biogenesis protein CcdA [Chitinophagales bacterium]
MKYFLSLFLLFFSTLVKAQFGFGGLGGSQEPLNPVTWKFSYDTVKGKPDEIILHFDAKLDEHWYIYSQFLGPGDIEPTQIIIEEGKVSKIGKPTESGDKPTDYFDEIMEQQVKKYYNFARFSQRYKILDFSKPLVGYIQSQTCNESCIPTTHDFKLDVAFLAKRLPLTTSIDTAQTAVIPIDTIAQSTPTGSNPQKSEDPLNLPTIGMASNVACEGTVAETPVADKGLLTIFFLGFIGGLLALITPCVFPMIPLTVSFFTKGSNDRRKGVYKAALYGFFILLIYVLLSVPFHVLDGVNPNILNEISTSAWLNLAFFVIFILFAFSFFGYFEITLPSGFTNKIDSASDVGGMIGIFFMALTLALVSFSCTGPILGSLLGLTAEGGTSAMELTAGMAGFGLALALPFALFAAFPGWLKNLPKSGGWLNSVKVVIAFVEIALAFKFLSTADLVMHWGLLKREVFFAIWVICGLGITLYLFGYIRFPHDSPIRMLGRRYPDGSPIKKLGRGRIAVGILTLVFTAYIAPGVTNTEYANVPLVSGFPPPMYYSIYERETQCPLDLDCNKNDFEAALKKAKEQHKPIMIDFTGYGCVNCRKNEEFVWPDQEVFDKLSNDYVLVSLYVDDKKALPDSEKRKFTYNNNTVRLNTTGDIWSFFQYKYFKTSSQPYYVVLSPDLEMLASPAGGLMNKEDFLKFLNCGLEGFNAQQEKLSQK